MPPEPVSPASGPRLTDAPPAPAPRPLACLARRHPAVAPNVIQRVRQCLLMRLSRPRPWGKLPLRRLGLDRAADDPASRPSRPEADSAVCPARGGGR